jgi:hypothetical protein
MKIKVYNNLPVSSDRWYWQIVFFPTVIVFRSVEKSNPYTAVSVEFLFWAVTILINDKRTVLSQEI